MINKYESCFSIYKTCLYFYYFMKNALKKVVIGFLISETILEILKST